MPAPDAPRPLVFLSHSGYEGEVKAVLEVLVDELSNSGFTPLLDRDTIPGGTDFHFRVHSMIATCHAAVLLLNRRAYTLESTWVFNETSRLQERAEEDKHFQAIPLYTEGLTPDDFRNAKWDPTGIARRNAEFTADSPQETARKVVAQLEDTRTRMTAGVVEREVRRLLSGVPENQLREVARPLVGRGIAGDVYVVVAKKLVAGGKYTPVRDFLRDVVKLGHFETARQVLTLVLPFMWVPREAVGRIPVAFAEGQPLGLNSRQPRTTKAYVHCASTVWPLWEVCDVGVGFDGESVEGLLQEAHDALAYNVGEIEFDAVSEPGLEDDEDERRPLVVLAVECPGFDLQIVDELESLLAARRRVGLVLLGGDVDWNQVSEPLRQRIVYLQPELVRAAEDKALKLMKDEPEDLERFHGAHLNSLRGP